MAAQPPPVVRVGVAAIVRDAQGRMVMGIRKGAHGGGQWQFPGGHLDVGESYLACAERETLEETGLVVRAEKMVGLTNDIFGPTKHYITIFVLCRRVDEWQEPKVMEPDKCEGWDWQSWSDVRAVIAGEHGTTKVFLPIANLLRDCPGIEALLNDTAAHQQIPQIPPSPPPNARVSLEPPTSAAPGP
ncbi:NUDIX hydrolase domain-like protein [Staphylotrichum tortipilum]|uniref:NUDIX hydrolase domain-like protein n=1 Tax=Staphylotrichum tortipilum TaxID=2831512 RepID=A0AAN6MIP8_9PEZI|nr:NUDIX hydrolase domain-like protein [Staphylotrichum longicolle]